MSRSRASTVKADSHVKTGNSLMLTLASTFMERRAKHMALAGLSFGVGSYLTTLLGKEPERLKYFSHDAIQNDRGLLHYLSELETYSHVEEDLFHMIVQGIDKMLILEQVLLNDDAVPTKEDRGETHGRFAVIRRHLQTFQSEVLSVLGSEHGVTASYYTKQIYENLQKHYLNILHLCNKYHPEGALRRAREERSVYEHAAREYSKKHHGRRLSFRRWKERTQQRKYPKRYRQYIDAMYDVDESDQDDKQ